MSMMMMMSEQKQRTHGGFCIGGGNGTGYDLASKRPKTEGSPGLDESSLSIRVKSQEKKDKLGERVAALQQLVSPFGKTDTASVLSEASGYIKFLHDQIQVLSAPYLRTTTIASNVEEAEESSLRSGGLCLVPVAATQRIAHSNGADLWAPIKSNNKP